MIKTHLWFLIVTCPDYHFGLLLLHDAFDSFNENIAFRAKTHFKPSHKPLMSKYLFVTGNLWLSFGAGVLVLLHGK